MAVRREKRVFYHSEPSTSLFCLRACPDGLTADELENFGGGCEGNSFVLNVYFGSH